MTTESDLISLSFNRESCTRPILDSLPAEASVFVASSAVDNSLALVAEHISPGRFDGSGRPRECAVLFGEDCHGAGVWVGVLLAHSGVVGVGAFGEGEGAHREEGENVCGLHFDR